MGQQAGSGRLLRFLLADYAPYVQESEHLPPSDEGPDTGRTDLRHNRVTLHTKTEEISVFDCETVRTP